MKCAETREMFARAPPCGVSITRFVIALPLLHTLLDSIETKVDTLQDDLGAMQGRGAPASAP